MISIAVCDDDMKQCSCIEDIILNYAKVNIEEFRTEVFLSAEELLCHLKNGEFYDLIFLDIEMGKIDGIEAGKLIREELDNYAVQIVYISSNHAHVGKVFDAMPMFFLDKPLQTLMIQKMIDKIMVDTERKGKTFLYMADREHKKVLIQDILYFKQLNRLVEIVCVNESDFFYGTLKDIYRQLGEYHFCYSHRSYIVNSKYIKRFHNRELTLLNGEKIPVSRSKYAEMKEIQEKISRRIG